MTPREIRERLREAPLTQLTMLTAGYVLRVIPVASIAGYILLAYAWTRIRGWIGYRGLAIAAAILLAAAAAAEALNTATGGALTGGPSVASRNPRDVAESVRWVADNLASPIALADSAIIAAALAAEALLIHRARRTLGRLLPRLLPPLLIAAALLYAASIPAALAAHNNLYSYAGRVEEEYGGKGALTDQELWSIMMGSFEAMAPLLAVRITGYIVFLAASIWEAVSFNNIRGEARRIIELERLVTREAEREEVDSIP